MESLLEVQEAMLPSVLIVARSIEVRIGCSFRVSVR
jgi:hypothetical protein